MRKNIIFAVLFCISFTALGQSVVPPPDVQADLLKKSKRQHTVASALAGGGGTLFVTGLLLFPKDYSIIFSNPPKLEQQANLAGVMFLTGVVALVTSIPFFSAAARNKRNAGKVALNFEMETSPAPLHPSFGQTSYPSLSLKIGL